MHDPDPPGGSAVIEELTAYLDGELAPGDRRRVEDRLAKDPNYRAEMQRLERTWRMLDCLPPARVTESFTRSTMAMVTVAAGQEHERSAYVLPRQRRRLRLGIAACVIAALAIGVGVGRRVWPDPNAPLVRDLPLLEDFDYYRHADSVDFLRTLDHDNVFDEEGSHAG